MRKNFLKMVLKQESAREILQIEIMQKRVHIFFTGKVQGVGFRATTKRLALNQKLQGWVRNLPDGRVEMYAEGGEQEIGNLLGTLSESFSITKMENAPTSDEGAHSGFVIRY